MSDQFHSCRRPAWGLPFVVTLVAMFALQLSNLGFSPLLPSIQQEFGMSYKQLGLFTGMYGLLALALSVPAGLCAKRFGEKRVLGVGLLGVAAGSVLLGQAWNFRVGARIPRVDDLRLSFRIRLCAHRNCAHGAAIAERPHDGNPRRDVCAVLPSSVRRSAVRSPMNWAGAWRFSATPQWPYWVSSRSGCFTGLLRVETSNGYERITRRRHGSNRSAFLSPVVWILALIVGMGGFGQFTVTNFVPSVAKALYSLDAQAAGVIISTGYMTAIVVNLIVGVLVGSLQQIGSCWAGSLFCWRSHRRR